MHLFGGRRDAENKKRAAFRGKVVLAKESY